MNRLGHAKAVIDAAILAPRAFLTGVLLHDTEQTRTGRRAVDAEAFECGRHLTRRLTRFKERADV